MSHVSSQSPNAPLKIQASAWSAGFFRMAAKRWSQLGLSVMLIGIRSIRVTSDKSQGIRSFVEGSPLISWSAQLLGIQDPLSLLGYVEILKGYLNELRALIPRISEIGSRLTARTFAIALMFIAAAPGAWLSAPGQSPLLAFPVQLVLKEIVLPAVSLWSLGTAVSKQLLASDL